MLYKYLLDSQNNVKRFFYLIPCTQSRIVKVVIKIKPCTQVNKKLRK